MGDQGDELVSGGLIEYMNIDKVAGLWIGKARAAECDLVIATKPGHAGSGIKTVVPGLGLVGIDAEPDRSVQNHSARRD